MCIRDRLYVTDIEGGYLGIDLTVRPDPKTIAAVWVPVSYTHLTVYEDKRGGQWYANSKAFR